MPSLIRGQSLGSQAPADGLVEGGGEWLGSLRPGRGWVSSCSSLVAGGWSRAPRGAAPGGEEAVAKATAYRVS